MKLIEKNNQLTLEHGDLSISIDFASPTLTHRRQSAGIKNELLAKAVGIKANYRPNVIDATAGLGRDAFLLAHFGCKITLLERSPLLYALLQDAIKRAKANQALLSIVEHMTLIQTDSKDYLTTLTAEQQADTIYLDPMFPSRNKSALVKKDMQILQQLDETHSNDEETKSLLASALTSAKKRVTVKRPNYAAPLADQTPSFALEGKKHRFDIYLC